jgi:hypothetical protein
MTGVTWARTMTDAMRARLLIWVSDQTTGAEAPSLGSFADAQEPLVIDSEHMDAIVSGLDSDGLVTPQPSLSGNMNSSSVTLTAKGKQVVQTMRDAQANQGLREAATREALVCWLNEKRLAAAPVDAGACPANMFILSPQAIFCGDLFTNDEQDRALHYLSEKGLIEDHTFNGGRTARLTAEGIDCASENDCDVREFLRAKNQQPSMVFQQTNYDNQGQIAQGQTVHQTQHQADSGPVLAAVAELLQTIAGDHSDDAETLRETLRRVQVEAKSDSPDRGVLTRLVNHIRSIGGRAESAAIGAGVTTALPVIENWVQTRT